MISQYEFHLELSIKVSTSHRREGQVMGFSKKFLWIDMAPPPRDIVDLGDVSDSSSLSDPLDTRNDEGWEDVEQDEEPTTVVSLFEERTFPGEIVTLSRQKILVENRPARFAGGSRKKGCRTRGGHQRGR